jgi:hypothetical protein
MATALGWDRGRTTRWTYRAGGLGGLFLLIAVLPPASPLGVVLPLATEVITMVVFLVAVLRTTRTTRRVW